MGFSSDMLGAARRAGVFLGSEGMAQVAAFARSRAGEQGGFVGRGGRPDLYYTVFGIDILLAAGESVAGPGLAAFIGAFADGDGLDLIHVSCLARCLSRVSGPVPDARAAAIAARIEAHRSADGGYSAVPGERHASIYGCFLAVAALQDLGFAVRDPARLRTAVLALRQRDGYFINERGIGLAAVNATVGGLLLLRELGDAPDARSVRWLMDQAHREGGFRAGPLAPIPDLVSTATALSALRLSGADLAGVRESCVGFVESLWDESGGFRSHWLDRDVDCEHTFHALLSLGCLA